ncbi:hypothetical protein ACFRH9_27645 [Peribacillus butanolivorans]|uniref:hypothetical protein n=1 Tax=Peribacillus butanolivorans TaxID=421767 RepID=UPI0036590BF5
MGNRTPKSRPIHFSFTKEYVVELSGALVENRGCHLVAFLLNELKGQFSLISSNDKIKEIMANIGAIQNG